MRKAIITLALCLSIPTGAAAQPLLISEVMYDLDGSDSGREWIEVYNIGDESFEILTGSGSDSFRFFDGSLHTLSLVHGTSTISVGGYAIFASDATSFLVDHPGFTGNLFDTVMSLKNTSSTIGLAQTREDPVFGSVTYDTAWGASGNGFTLERSELSESATWLEGAILGGTPGYWELPSDNTPTTTPPGDAEEDIDESEDDEEEGDPTEESPPDLDDTTEDDASGEPPTNSGSVDTSMYIHISELLPNPSGLDSGEWIELYNESPFTVDIAGWQVQDNTSKVYTIEGDDFDTTEVDPFGYFVLAREVSGIALNNSGGDSVILYAPGGDFREKTSYMDSALEDMSWALVNGTWRWTTEVTAGAANIGSVDEPPIARLSVSGKDDRYYVDDKLSFDGSASSDAESRTLDYHWDFGDDTTDDEKKTSHAFSGPGDYTVVLQVADSSGQTDATSLTVTIVEDSEDLTLGQVQPITFTEDDLRITELLPNPEGSDDGEWIELKNSSDSMIDLTGWQLDDGDGGSKPYFLPQGTEIASNAYFVVNRSDSGLSLNNGSDSARLLTPLGQVWHEVRYEKAASGESYAFDELNEEWSWTATPSPASQNTIEFVSEPDVLGFETPTIERFSDITEDLIGHLLGVRGLVVVPPHTIGKQRMYIAELDGGSYIPFDLLEVYQYRGEFGEIEQGDIVEIIGELSWVRERPRIKIISEHDISLIEKKSLDRSEALRLIDVDVDRDRSWVSVEGTVVRVNKKSFSIEEGDESMTVYLPADVPITTLELRKGDTVFISGFVQFRSGKPTLRMIHLSDLSIVDVAAEGGPTSYDMEEHIEQGIPATEEPIRPWLYMSTVPATVGIGWLIKKFLLVKFQ